MFLNSNTNVKRISARLSSQQMEAITAFIKGAVYAYCNNNQNADGNSMNFSVHNLFGEDNYYWIEPLIGIYNYHFNNGKPSQKAVAAAGKDVGILLKNILLEDTRTYEISKKQRKYMVNTYRWIK